MEGLDGVFAIGDQCIMTADPDYPGGHPQLAQVAIQQGTLLAANLERLERGEALQSSVGHPSVPMRAWRIYAHEQYGLVKKGEVAVNVSGVTDSSDESSTIPPNVSADSIDPPDTWYSGILDPLFGVE